MYNNKTNVICFIFNLKKISPIRISRRRSGLESLRNHYYNHYYHLELLLGY